MFVCIIGIGVPPSALSQNLLINGSFEEGPPLGSFQDITLAAGSTAITGWVVTGQSIDFTGPPWDCSDGSHCVDLNGDDAGGIQQTFVTVPGETYVVSFDLSGNPSGLPTLKQVRVVVDGVQEEYTFDSSGQSVSALNWQSVVLPFVASGSSAILSFISLSSTPSSYGPLIDHVSVTGPVTPDCAYSFSSGSGASLVQYCVSAKGTLQRLESPAGQEHIAVGQIWEGFIVCSGNTLQGWDLGASEDGFGPATLVKRQTTTGVTLRRLSPQYQLEQAFALDKDETDVTVTMTLTNISGITIPDVRIARAYDPDPNNDAGDDLEVKSASGVWASDVDAVTLTGLARGVPLETAVDTGVGPSCSPVGAAGPIVTGDSSLATLVYHVGDMLAKSKKTVVFVYRVQ
jgi:choice-of-anchor C domain-containing protein